MLRKIFYFVLLLSVLIINYGCGKDGDNNPTDTTVDDQIDGFTLKWSDEFSGSSINPNNWIHEVNAAGAANNNELQYYTARSENSFVKDGKLHLVALAERYTGNEGTRDYTSARITTQHTQALLYGRIEAKMKLPFGQGLWPAFWLLGVNISSVGWPECGEIDIVEMIGGGDGRDNVTHGTLHWNNNGHQYTGASKKLLTGNLSDDFHIYAIEWDENKIDWYFDNELFYTINITPSHMYSFHNPFFIILNVAVGGNWPGSPSPSTIFPQEMVVDYVRAYSKDE